MAEKKITKREIISRMLADKVILANADYVAYLKHELELLNKKAERKNKSEEELAEMQRLLNLVTDTLAIIGKGTVTEIQKANAELSELSNQKVTSLLGTLKKEEVVIRATENRKTVFYLA